MKLTTTFRVLYYGILASVTGGFVIPLRDIKNWKYVAVFHIYSFIMFFAPPLGLFYVSLTHCTLSCDTLCVPANVPNMNRCGVYMCGGQAGLYPILTLGVS